VKSENVKERRQEEVDIVSCWILLDLDLECLPDIDISKQSELKWLVPHTAGMFSSRERALRDLPTPLDKEKEVRVSFKDSLFSLVIHFTGLQGQKAHIFGLNKLTGGGIHILILGSNLKLDVANHTIVLDAAILPL
jgi:hypothetical protein